MGTVVFGSGPFATLTGTGILEPVIITYFFLAPPPCGAAHARGLSVTSMVPTIRLIICLVFMCSRSVALCSVPWRVRGILWCYPRVAASSLFRDGVENEIAGWSDEIDPTV